MSMRTATLRDRVPLIERSRSYLWIAHYYPRYVQDTLYFLGYARGYNDFWRGRSYFENCLRSQEAKHGYYWGWDKAQYEASNFNPNVSELPLMPTAVLINSPHFDWEAYQNAQCRCVNRE